MGRILRITVLVVFAFTGYHTLAQHVVISEVYGGGGNTGATYKNDFVELYNPTGSDVVMTNWSVQYGSAGSTGAWSGVVTISSGTIKSKGYFLVKLAGSTVGSDLPTADATNTSVNLSATSGKVALSSNTTTLSGATPVSANLIDLVGFGAANGFEGALAPAPSNSASIERKANASSTAASMNVGGLDEFLANGYDSDNNSNDFVVRTVPQPQSTMSGLEPDNTPPVFTSTYPKTANVTESTFDLIVSLDEVGKVYYVVLPDAASAPSVAQVKAGQDDTGASVSNSGFVSVTASVTDAIKNITGLSPSTSYDIYVVAVDAPSNAQASTVKLDVTTAASTTPLTSPSVTAVTFSGLTVKTQQSVPTSYTITAVNLTDNVNVSVTANYMISSDNVNYTSSLVIDKTLFPTAQTIYIKFNPSGNVGTLTGTITHSTVGGIDKLITLSAISIDPFNQNFNDPAFLTTSGWTQYSVIGAQVWATTNFGHTCLTGCTTATVDKAVEINGFTTIDVANEDWLISPQMDITGFVNFPALSFWTISAFDGPSLQLKYSTDYIGTGDPSVATWTTLDGKFPAPNSSLWTKSSNIILPKSVIYVAVVYTSTTTAASRWTFDDWKVEDLSAYVDVPAIAFSFGDVAAGSHSASKNFAFTAKGYGDITLIAPDGYEVSVDDAVYASSQVIVEADAAAGKTIYIRFAPATKKINWDGTISFKGTGLDATYGSVTGSSYPKSETFDLTAYNLEFFAAPLATFGPSNDALQVTNVTTVMQTVNSDIFSVEEVSVDAAIDQVVAGLPGYKKIISDRWSYSFKGEDPTFPDQKIGFIYNTATVNVVSSRVMFVKLFDDIRAGKATLPNYPEDPTHFYASGRLPFMVTADITMNSVKKRVKIIVLHSRSGSDVADYNMRNYDIKVLHDSLTANYANDNLIIMGDFNDDVDASINTGSPSTYKVFVDDTQNFNVLTYPLSQTGAYSFPSSSSFLDHIIVSNEFSGNYIANSVIVEDPRSYIASYSTTTSDHLPVSARFTLSVQGPQTITFTSLPTKTMGDASFTLTATSTSGLAVTYTSSDASIASVDASGKVTIKKAGTVTITASQAGDSGYLAAADVKQTLTINKASQTITFTAPTTKTVGDAAFTLAATSTSGLAVSFSTTNTDKVTLSGSQVTIVKAGSVTISANQTGNESFIAAPTVNQTFCINPAKPMITVSGVNTESPTLTSSATTGNQWYLNNAAITGATNATYSATAAGIYKVQVKADNCVSAFSNDTPLIVTGDIQSAIEQVTVYPNPVEDYLMISGLRPEITECVITDMTGRTSILKLDNRNGVHRGDVQGYSQGLYVARVQSDNTMQQIKFIKK